MEKLINGDCFEEINKIEDNSIDLVLTDPPFNIAIASKLTKRRNKICSPAEAWGTEFKDNWENFEEYRKFINDIAKMCFQKLKKFGQMVIFLDRKYTGLFIYDFEKLGYIFNNKIYFIVKNPIPCIRKRNYRSCVSEAIWVVKGNKYFFNFVSQFEDRQVFYGNIGQKESEHPTEKAIWQISPLIKKHSNAGDLVMDPFMGSGTVGVVSKSMDRNFTGIELSPYFYAMAKKRIEKVKKTEKLW